MIKDIEKKLAEGNLKFKWKIMQDLETIPIEENILKYPLLILTCMDPRIDVHRIFQLNPGDVLVYRNAGNIYTTDMLRTILLAIVKFKINYIIVLGHLDCGMTKINLKELRMKLPSEFLSQLSKNYSEVLSELNSFFRPFNNEIENIRRQIKTLDSIKDLYPEIEITGMLYDIKTGLVFEYETFKDYKLFENFEKKYKEMIVEKKEQFADFLINYEAEKILENESKDISQESGLSEVGIPLTPRNNEIKEDYPIVEHEKSEEYKMKSIIPKISVPKIQFHKVKIYIPNTIRK
ncbi:MAG: carbonic anhydrase [Promethearchaeota archaeon]